MNLIKLSLVLTFFSVVSFSVQAQNVKPKFKKLIYVPYYLQLSGKDTVHYIGEYLEINENGQAHYIIAFTSRPEVRDTVYQLPDTLIEKLNKIFNEKSKLDSYRIAEKQPNGFIYKGRLIFLSFIDLNDKPHYYIDVKPYMSPEFNMVLDAIIHRARHVTYEDMRLDTKELLNQIIKIQAECKYCSKIEDLSKTPPTVQRLDIADPHHKH